ncbi:hypothetical protein BD779DRAFT_1768420 [Infundibulicybe gibba]|nr:hypothetical protein BD779DRAFT_1768420 [Infundibulicybe gibba]
MDPKLIVHVPIMQKSNPPNTRIRGDRQAIPMDTPRHSRGPNPERQTAGWKKPRRSPSLLGGQDDVFRAIGQALEGDDMFWAAWGWIYSMRSPDISVLMDATHSHLGSDRCPDFYKYTVLDLCADFFHSGPQCESLMLLLSPSRPSASKTCIGAKINRGSAAEGIGYDLVVDMPSRPDSPVARSPPLYSRGSNTDMEYEFF